MRKIRMKGCTQFTWPCQINCRTPSFAGFTARIKAGLLALGSFYFLHLPISLIPETVVFADFVPDHSGGTAPDFNGIPYQALPGTFTTEVCIKAAGLCQLGKRFPFMAPICSGRQADTTLSSCL